ncbi:oxo-acid lyase [Escherichia coli]
MQKINFYRNRVAINVLAKDIANAREIFDAAEGHAVIGVLSAQFSSVDEGIQEVKRWMAEIPSISVGLGAGDPAQYYKAAMIAAQIHPAHVNQTFTGCGFAAGALAATGGEQTHVNALVSPTGTPGEVLISTGVSSSQGTPARVSCDTAVRNGMTLIEPTGGIDLDNFSVILKTCLEAGVPRIMPHVYSSIIDPDTGYTRPDDVAVLLNKVKSLL